MKRAGTSAALALLAAGCAAGPSPPLTYYDCAVTLADENGEFVVHELDFRWDYPTAEDRLVAVNLDEPSTTSFLAAGFSERAQPYLTVSFPSRFATGIEEIPWNETTPPFSRSVDVRIGDRSVTDSGPNLYLTTFFYEEWGALLSEEGDMRVALIDDRTGMVLASSMIPRSALDSVEPTLLGMAAEFVDKGTDAPNRCTPGEPRYEPIFY